MAWEVVIGLEVHVELSTKTKIFCGCSTAFGGEPNSHTCPICLGMPGTLPVLNEEVVNKAIAAGVALNCTINTRNIFDRKNYFYPDLPKNYQISQLYHPICQNGHVRIKTGDTEKDIRIHEIHMEEDAGKLIHETGVTLVDYNRGGVPLIEIVSEPDMRNADEVCAYLEILRETLVYLNVSDCKMQEGSMRADVNLSIREEGSETFGTRTETKNMNSIKAIRRAIAYETDRQIALLEAGKSVVQETRRWDDNTGENYAMRSKENAQDYRYFPDPDLVPLFIDELWIQRVKDAFPELAAEKRARYTEAFGLSEKTAGVLTAERNIAELFEEIMEQLLGKFEKRPGAEPYAEEQIRKVAQEAANVVTGEILRLVGENNIEPGELSLDAAKIAEILYLVHAKKINRAAGKETVEAVFKDDVDPETYIKDKNLSLIGDESGIREAAAKVLSENPQSVEDFKAGKEKAFGFLVGKTMGAFGGKADPAVVNAALKELLNGVKPQQTEGEGEKNKESLSQIGGEPDQSKTSPDGNGQKRTVVDTQDMPEAEQEGNDSAAQGPVSEEPAWKRAKTGYDTESGAAAGAADGKSATVPQSGRYRDLTCGELRPSHIGKTVKLAGWVMTIRDHGGIVFIDLRDQYGVTQVSCKEEQLAGLNKECSVSVKGTVIARDPETFNPNIATGEVEIKAEELEILGPCRPSLPFEVENSRETREELRLKYRYLDLRNQKLKDNLFLRAEIIKHLRQEMESMGFLEVQTPILANSSPEGARDYLVPSRKHKGKFYALPQAPQQFKQLLMASGFDRYFQIAPCFRDEDARLDRSPGEFYQLDFEMAYATQEDVFSVAEQVLTTTFSRFSDKKVSKPPYVRIPFAEAMLRFGTDKPDLRNPLEIIDLSEFFASVDFAPFKGKIVRSIRVPGAGAQPRSFFRDMENFATKTVGMKGLGYVTVQEDGTYKGPIDKFLTDEQKKELKELSAIAPGDVLYFISDEPEKVAHFAGQIRTEVAQRLDIIAKDRYELCFITDFPMYEYNDDAGKIDFTHNPFSMPQGEMESLQSKDPLDILAWQYDIVCNGVELSSGAVRNHRPDIMVKAFEIAGYTEKDVEEKFGALYTAFSYGAPPHAGMAPGVDRVVMLLAEEENIRETIAFPLNSNAQNLMLDAPGEVTEHQLREVHIKIR